MTEILGLDQSLEIVMGGRGMNGIVFPLVILFLVVNTSSVQLLPTTMIALRAQAGAANPADIVLPTLLATAASTLCGIAACRAFARCGA